MLANYIRNGESVSKSVGLYMGGLYSGGGLIFGGLRYRVYAIIFLP